MSENIRKITKKEQKEMEKQNLRSFTQRTFETVMEMIPAGTEQLRSKIQVKITFQNWNRYVRFSSYGQYCNIQIFTNGNIVLELYEALHNKYVKQLFEFSYDEKAQEEFLSHFREILSWLIPVFAEMTGYDFHTYMDFVDDETDFETAYEKVQKAFH